MTRRAITKTVSFTPSDAAYLEQVKSETGFSISTLIRQYIATDRAARTSRPPLTPNVPQPCESGSPKC